MTNESGELFAHHRSFFALPAIGDFFLVATIPVKMKIKNGMFEHTSGDSTGAGSLGAESAKTQHQNMNL